MRRNVFWGGMLIVAGSVLLLDRYISFSMWSRLWPLFLVTIGLWFVWKSTRSYEPLPTESLELPLDSASRARIVLRHGLGELNVSSGGDPEVLLAGQCEGGCRWHREQAGDTVQVRLEPRVQGTPVLSGLWTKRNDGYAWRLRLNPEVPLTLEAEGGLSSNNYDLSELNCKSFRLKGGLASTVVNLPLHAGHTRAHIETGLASVRINVPDGVAARIRTSGGLSSNDVDQLRFPYLDREYISPDYGEAENRVDIEVELGLGSLTVR